MQSAPVIPCWLPPPATIPADAAGPPRFRHVPFARDMASDPGGAIAPRDSGTTHFAFGAHDGLGLHNVVISWLNPIPHAITVYASDPALPRRPQHSLPGGSLRLTRTGLSPVGSRQLRLVHRLATPWKPARTASLNNRTAGCTWVSSRRMPSLFSARNSARDRAGRFPAPRRHRQL
jgi:hypothetical protein